MKLTVLGSGTCVPEPDKSSSGYLLEAGGRALLLDSGSGTVRRIAEAGFNYAEIAYLFCTHFHIDHIGDLQTLLFARMNDPGAHNRVELHVYAPTGIKEFLSALAATYGNQLKEEIESLSVTEVKPGDELSVGNVEIEVHKTLHTRRSVCYRFTDENGAVFAYTGDTGISDEVKKLLNGADLALVECSLPHADRVETHLSPENAGSLANEAGVKRLLLTHFYPSLYEVDVRALVRASYTGEILFAEDLNTYEI